MKIALVQMEMSGEQEDILSKCLKSIETAKKEKADLVLFPELTLLPFFPQYEGLSVQERAIPLSHPYVRAFQEACRENEILAVPNFYLEENGKRYDASLVISESGEILCVQKMVHIAQAEQFYEQDYYEPSDDGFLIAETKLGRIGVIVCFDRHYPESIRTESLRGADCILIPTANTKAEPLEMFAWEVAVQAFQNCVPIAMCNRVGLEGAMDFAGESLVTDACGNVLAKADDTEQILYAEIDLRATEQIKRSKPYLSLRRPELY